MADIKWEAVPETDDSNHVRWADMEAGDTITGKVIAWNPTQGYKSSYSDKHCGFVTLEVEEDEELVERTMVFYYGQLGDDVNKAVNLVGVGNPIQVVFNGKVKTKDGRRDRYDWTVNTPPVDTIDVKEAVVTEVDVADDDAPAVKEEDDSGDVF